MHLSLFMNRRSTLCCIAMLFACLLWNYEIAHAQSQAPVSIIFDSDMGPDYDVVGAITLLHALADSGKVKILATVASTKFEGVAGVLDVFNTYFGRPDILIGVPKGQALELKDWQHWTDTLLRRYPHSIKQNAEVPDAVDIYRKVLAKASDRSVTIVTVGFLTNLAGLLKSPPDKYSKLTGKELIQKKVKQLVSMAGGFPQGKEFNVHKDAAASRIVFENWNTPVLLSGFEIGVKIKTGVPLIGNTAIVNSPVKDVFSLSIPMDKQDVNGRSSWDETAVLIAAKGYQPYYKIQAGKIVVAEDGSNTWDVDGKGQSYIIENQPVEVVQKVINDLIMHQPKK
jgi:pyrimidine-specific ribonucleoside hydrolase